MLDLNLLLLLNLKKHVHVARRRCRRHEIDSLR
jgi:hypothetical protein